MEVRRRRTGLGKTETFALWIPDIAKEMVSFQVHVLENVLQDVNVGIIDKMHATE